MTGLFGVTLFAPSALAISVLDFRGVVLYCQAKSQTERLCKHSRGWFGKRSSLCVPDAGKGQRGSGHLSWHKQ